MKLGARGDTLSIGDGRCWGRVEASALRNVSDSTIRCGCLSMGEALEIRENGLGGAAEPGEGRNLGPPSPDYNVWNMGTGISV